MVGATVITDTLALLVLLRRLARLRIRSNLLVSLPPAVAIGLFTRGLPGRQPAVPRPRSEPSRPVRVPVLAFLAAALWPGVRARGIVLRLGLNRSVPNGSPLMEVTDLGNSLFIRSSHLHRTSSCPPSCSSTNLAGGCCCCGSHRGQGAGSGGGGRLSRFAWNVGLMFAHPAAGGGHPGGRVGGFGSGSSIPPCQRGPGRRRPELLISSATTHSSPTVSQCPGAERPIGERVLLGLAEETQAATLPIFHRSGTRRRGHDRPRACDRRRCHGRHWPTSEVRKSMAATWPRPALRGETHVRLDQSTALGLRNAGIETMPGADRGQPPRRISGGSATGALIRSWRRHPYGARDRRSAEGATHRGHRRAVDTLASAVIDVDLLP
jgi:hypothetical protein